MDGKEGALSFVNIQSRIVAKGKAPSFSVAAACAQQRRRALHFYLRRRDGALEKGPPFPLPRQRRVGAGGKAPPFAVGTDGRGGGRDGGAWGA